MIIVFMWFVQTSMFSGIVCIIYLTTFKEHGLMLDLTIPGSFDE